MDLSKDIFVILHSVNPDQTLQNHYCLFTVHDFLQTYIKQNWHQIDISSSAEHLQKV